jgi:two-component system CheB/CheR fusion protein
VVPTIILDANGSVTVINDRARQLFGLSVHEVGRPLQDLEVSYRPTELRSLVDEATAQRRTAERRGVEWTAAGGGQPTYLDVAVEPLLDTHSTLIGCSITFQDVTDFRRLQQELLQSNRDLEGAYEELQSTNEELETTNEELQSTVEELETTNEELQSTNEELETINEELHSTNDELQTVNEELERRGVELNDLNHYLESILSCLRLAVVVIDAQRTVRTWNKWSQELWGLRTDEAVGEPFFDLDFGLPLAPLRAPVDAVFSVGTDQEVVVDAHDRRGRPVRCRVRCTPLQGPGGPPDGVIVVMETVESES